MPKIVFQIVPVVLQHIGMLILYLPPRTPAVSKHFHVIRCYLFVRYLAVAERLLLLLFVPDAQLQPVYLQRWFFLFCISIPENL